MSYLITSNVPTDDVSQKDGINKPFSYFNNLQNTHIIPANSEIAVESCKIVKDGRISVNRQNNVFYFYYGEKLSSTKPIEDTLYHPIRASIYANGQDGNNAQVNVDEFADMLDDTVRRSLYHPNLQPSDLNSSSSVCSVKRDGSNLDFEGFQISITSSASTDNASHINKTWIPATFDQSDIDIPNGSGVTNSTSVGVNHLDCIGTQFPLSLAGGSCEFNLENLATLNLDLEWIVGLSRCTRTTTKSGGLAPVLASPEYFEDNAGGIAGGGGDNFYDYMVTSEFDGTDYNMKIYQSLFNPDTDELEMVEFDYRQSREYNKGKYVRTNASDIESVRFTATGEQMKIEFYDGTLAQYEDIVTGKNASSVLNLKPINQNCWLMFPKMRIPQGEDIYLEDYNGVPIDNFEYGGVTSDDNDIPMTDKQSNQDWWATQTNLNRQSTYCKNVDNRYMIHTTQYEGSKSRAYTQKGLTVSGDPDLNSVFILQQSDLYNPSRFASAGRILGFPNRPILDSPTSSTGTTVNFVSDTTPKFIPAGSVFVRLKNLTFNSQNFAKGSQSKIIYHLPQFDNTGSEHGSLFFQPPERMYLKLNNPNEIYLNDLDVEFVYSDEKLCTSLVGKTIVCFHIRKSKDEIKMK